MVVTFYEIAIRFASVKPGFTVLFDLRSSNIVLISVYIDYGHMISTERFPRTFSCQMDLPRALFDSSVRTLEFRSSDKAKLVARHITCLLHYKVRYSIKGRKI